MAYTEDTYGRTQGRREGSGLIVTGLFFFAAVMMLVQGTFHVLNGLAALLDDGFITAATNYAYDIDVNTWGWLHLITGIALVFAGIGLILGAIWARLLALFIIVASGIINFVYIPYQPLWSIVQLALDGAIIWALLSYGMTDEDL
jgi:hypothetical protein